MTTFQKNPVPEKGKLLLAEPFMADGNFARSVILLTEHNEEGSVGFMLNKPADLNVQDVVRELKNVSFDAPLFLGGPVQQNSLHFIHRLGDLIPGSIEFVNGTFAGGDFDSLFELIGLNKISPKDIRFFLGYAGWSPGQLQSELDANAWIVSPARKRFSFSDNPEALWQTVLKEMGKKFQRISLYPENPSLN